MNLKRGKFIYFNLDKKKRSFRNNKIICENTQVLRYIYIYTVILEYVKPYKIYIYIIPLYNINI